MKTTTEKKQTLPVTVKNVKHTFTDAELSDLGQQLARAYSDRRNVENEFDQVKQSYKARLAESDTRIGTVSTDLLNKFTMRNEECYVLFRPKDREKDFFVKTAIDFLISHNVDMDIDRAIKIAASDSVNFGPALTEPMTHDDYQTELLQAEQKFDHRLEFNIFPPVNTDSGVMVVGKFGDRWFSALRITIGRSKLEERLNSEQKSFKIRDDAIKHAGKRAGAWFKEEFGDNAKGFEEPLAKALAEQAERVE